MSDLAFEERNQQYRARLQYIEDVFRNKITDPNIRFYIFNSTENRKCANKVTDYVSYINNIMKLAFVFAYGCFRLDSIDEQSCCERAVRTSSLRIINSLKKTYVQYPATPDLIEFVLTDIQFDMMQGSNSELYEIFEHLGNFSNRNFSLSRYFKLIKTWLSCPSRFSMDPNELAARFALFLDNMTFLSNYKLVENKDAGDFYFIEKKAELFDQYDKFSMIPANHLLFRDDEKYYGIYTLFGCDRRDDKETKLNLRYISSDGYTSINVTASETPPEDESYGIIVNPEEYYSEITGTSMSASDPEEGQNPNSNFINQVHTINYKYIKNLALAVSDAISGNIGARKVLLDAFRVHHPNIFIREGRSTDILESAADWDGITVMLLIEASPTRVLEVLFHREPQTFYDISKNLCKRIDNPDMPIYGCNNAMLDKKVDEIICSHRIDDESIRKWRNSKVGGKLYAKAAAILIISSLSSLMEEESDEKLICVGNIHENLSLLTKMSSEPPDDKTVQNVSAILGETFRRLNCFYKGIEAYGAIKALFDNESSDCCLSRAKVKVYQTQLKNAFMESAKAEAQRLAGYDSTRNQDTEFIIKEFIKLCNQCSSSSNMGDNSGRSLYVTLGKYEIMNVNEFKNRVSAFFGTYGDIDHLDESGIKAYIQLALDILKFLIFGNFDSGATTGIPINAVYPLSATYSRGNENYDGYKTATFTLNIDMDFDEINDKEDVNVLTEFFHVPGDVFYCLPNVLRSNKKWWIDPILVGFKEFNEIFTK
ncbi:MAG: hypothetical protein J6S71_03365 [Clostridia bacterium]|nr:hypothetical protein [Clostridia bacterium]